MLRLQYASLLCLAVLTSLPAYAVQPLAMDYLLNQVRQGRIHDSRENAQRIREFTRNKASQQALLTEAKNAQARQEQRSAMLEREFNENEKAITREEARLKERMGSMKELFGVVQQVSGDTGGIFEHSLTRAQYPDRSAFLEDLAKKMGQSSRLASLQEIERLWFELHREMTESGKVVKFQSKVISADGNQSSREVTRIGLFNLVADGKYLDLVPETGNIIELVRQPADRYLHRLVEYQDQRSGMHAVALDPSRGQLLSLLVQTPGLTERIEQGGVIGYVILALGAFALLIAAQRMLLLSWTGISVHRQANDMEHAGNNPLGRVLRVYMENTNSDIESLELKLSEAILKETPNISKRLMLLKVIAVIAPLLGLLGTVTGMIVTFQSITLFGTGDPKLMAGGISTALVTTVLGLCVAIPTVLLHTLVSGQAKRISEILEEQSIGMVAEHAEATLAATA